MDGDGCSSDCFTLVPVICGAGIRYLGVEACDDGNTVSNDGCSGDCLSSDFGWNCTEDGGGLSTCSPAECGAGILAVGAGGEACDDGNTNDDDGCSADCLTLEVCGDGILESGGSLMEVCDDSNTVDDDGCSADCSTFEVCGDGIVDSGAPL